MTQFNRDTYSYLWPRDGALVAHALDLSGYPEVSLRFFQFCADVLTQDGFLLHKYNPDKSLASSWHPWIVGGVPQIPIQEDETALVVWALWKHFQRYRDLESVKPLYGRLIRKAADFMVRYREPLTKLPAPSYDPVSYTHLDVYKRQSHDHAGMNCCSKTSRKGRLSLIHI